jgi:hypothetical protein
VSNPEELWRTAEQFAELAAEFTELDEQVGPLWFRFWFVHPTTPFHKAYVFLYDADDYQDIPIRDLELRMFPCPLPSRFFGLEEDKEVRAIGYLLTPADERTYALVNTLFAKAAKAFSGGQEASPEWWLCLLIQECFKNSVLLWWQDPDRESLVPIFSEGPYILNVEGDILWSLADVLNYCARNSWGLFCLPEDDVEHVKTHAPWLLWAKQSWPIKASAALCAQYANYWFTRWEKARFQIPVGNLSLEQTPQEEPANDGDSRKKVQKAKERLLKMLAEATGEACIQEAADVIASERPLNERITKVMDLVPCIRNYSSHQLGALFEVSHKAVQYTTWWKQNRKGEKDRRIAEREDRLRERGKTTTQRELQGGNPD